MRLSFASVKEVTQGYMRRQFASQILSTLWSPCSALRSCGHHPAVKIFDEGPLDGVLRDWVPKPNTFDLFFPLQPNQTRCVHPSPEDLPRLRGHGANPRQQGRTSTGTGRWTGAAWSWKSIGPVVLGPARTQVSVWIWILPLKHIA